MQQLHRYAASGRLNHGISVDLDDHIALSKIAARHANVGYSVGVHPCENAENMETRHYLNNSLLGRADKVWALGETGWTIFTVPILSQSKKPVLHYIFTSQAVKKPVVVHTRAVSIIQWILSVQKNRSMGILHCFTEDGNCKSGVRLRLLCVFFRVYFF